MPSDSPNALRRLWPLYLGEFFVLLALVLGVGAAAGSAFPYLFFVIAALFACWLGFVLRRLGVDNETGIYALLLIGALIWFIAPLREFLISRMDMPGVSVWFGPSIAVVLVCLALGLAAVATTDGAIAFVIVPGVSAFGTCGEMELGPSFMAAFLLFVFASVFVLAFQHVLARTARPGSYVRPPQSARRALLFASLFCLFLFLSAHLATRITSRSLPSPATSHVTAPASRFLPRLPINPLLFPDQPLQLGSTPPPPSQREAFQVRCNTSLFWRLTVYNEYTGKSWSSPPPQNPQRIAAPYNFVGFVPHAPLKGQLVQQTFQIRSLFSTRVPAAATPIGIQGISSSLLVDGFGCIQGNEGVPTHPGANYAVTSLVAFPSTDELRQIAPQYPIASLAHYLRLPQSAYQVSQIADRVAGSQPTPYEKIIALQRYLERDFVYTLRPPPAPRDRDFVTWFLTDAKAGYCEAFASALVVMARSLGIPARLATGFAPGDFDSSTQTFVVREKDAHAWAEIYFGEGFGWLAFDPQPTRRETRDLSPSLTLLQPFRLRARLFATNPATFVVGLICICAVVLLVGPLAVKLLGYRLPKRLSPRDEKGRICQLYAFMCSSLASLGLPRSPSQTPLEYLSHLSHRLRYTSLDILGHIRHLTDLCVLACYSPGPVTSEHLQSAASSLEIVKRSVRLLRSQR